MVIRYVNSEMYITVYTLSVVYSTVLSVFGQTEAVSGDSGDSPTSTAGTTTLLYCTLIYSWVANMKT